MYRFLLTAAVLSSMALPSSAQTMAAADAVAPGHTYEYFVSEAMHAATLASPALVVIPGMLQPTVPAGAGHLPKQVAGLEVYPSPIFATLYLKPNSGKGGRLQCKLFDAEGTMIWNKVAQLERGDELQQVTVGELANGEYTLLVHWLEGAGTQISAYRLLKVK